MKNIPNLMRSQLLWLGLCVGFFGFISFNSHHQGYSAARPVLPAPITDTKTTEAPGKKTAILAGGCFWGMEAIFENLKGVSDVVSGFTGGSAQTAYYETVSSGQTDHAEAIQITYDPTQISYGTLLHIFFSVAHDPTQLNYQGPDRGPQYRSAIFFNSPEQQRIAQAYIEQLNKPPVFAKPIVTKLQPFQVFYPAGESHQDFIVRNPTYPYVVEHDLPKLQQLKTQFPTFLKP